jgi:flagellar basal-body rod protein FlgB
MKGLFEEHLGLVQKVMDLRLIRQNIVASNIANIENPNYKARRIDFEEKLQEALNLKDSGRITRTNKKHLPNSITIWPDFHKELEIRVIQGEDSVNLDKEMAIQAKNVIAYNTLSTIMKKEFEMLSQVITEGGK